MKLVYFKGCPTVPRAREILRSLGVGFEEVIQDDLPAEDPLRGFSSPSLVLGGKLVIGSENAGACSFGAWESAEQVREIFAKGEKSG